LAGLFALASSSLNGRRVVAQALDDSGLLLDNGVRIAFDRVKYSARKFAPRMQRSRHQPDRPRRMFLVDECKWKSRASMQFPTGHAEAGWCIHEV
jgi:hypothetical protein